jgi:tRNA(fMet)-specific endonuclease VapC
MDKYLLDTNILIGYFRKNEKFLKIINELTKKGEIFISQITRLEMIKGMRKNEIQKTFYLLNVICKTINLTSSTMSVAEDIILNLKMNDIIIDIGDAIIAASAIEDDLTLFTMNLKHFEKIKNLKIGKIS